MPMSPYHDIPIWTLFSRIHQLRRFEQQLRQYFALLDTNSPAEQTARRDLRKKINESAYRIIDILQAAQVDPMHAHGKPLNLITHVFQLEQHGLHPQDVYDLLHRGIGVYQQNRFWAWVRSMNPFFYIWRLLDFLGGILFASMGVPKNQRQGGIVKFMQGALTLIITLITVCSAGLSIADHLGYEPDISGFWQSKGKHILKHYHIRHYRLPNWLQY